MLEYRNLETFATVILEGGFDKAARKLNLTQSAVSQRVRLLEEQHGQILLQRSTPPLPTEAGLPLLYHYRKVKQLEDDLRTATAQTRDGVFNTVAIAVNADTLATWLYPALAGLLDSHRLVVDLQVDDQDATHQLMQSGHVWGCISTRPASLQGCGTVRLGGVRYAMFSTTSFRDRWFPEGLNEERLARAPMARYNRKDDLNSRLFEVLGVTPTLTPPTFYVPSTEMYGHFVAEGRCWGVLPEQQSKPLERDGQIVNLSPQHWVEVVLYWHCWNRKSDLMDDFSKRFAAEARRCLRFA
jgi:LysR family transcriptional regulator (chromosome initiation inhibitor)